VRGILDASVFLAREQQRELDAASLPDEAAISVVTLAELELGVHLADSEATRAQRLGTLGAARATYLALPVDEPVAAAFTELVAGARRIQRRLKLQDAWIAATARAHAAAIYTQDSDFDGLQGVEVVHV
jgi:predicted nucleic acid-binding protein